MAVKRYDGSAWQTVAGLGAQGPAATSSSIATWVKTASGGETSLSGNDDNSQALSYTVGQELVFINGTLLKRGSDYTATNGTSITGLTALAANDVATVWTVNAFSVTGAIANTIVDAKGDLIVATGADTPGRLAVGSNNQVLTADSTTGTGLKWATPAAGGGLTELASGTLSGNSIELTSISSSYKKLILTMSNFYVNTRANLQLTVNSDNSGIYAQTGVTSTSDGSIQTPSATAAQGWSSSYDWIGNGANVFTGSTMRNYAEIEFLNYADTSAYKIWRATTYQQDNTSTFRQNLSTTVYRSASAISTIKVKVESTNTFSGGTYKLWGLN